MTSPLNIDKNRFSMLFQNAALGIAVVNPKTGRFVEVNPYFCEMMEYTKEELLLLDVKSVTHVEDTKLHLKQTKNNLDSLSENSFYIEKRYIKKTGGILYAQSTITQIYDSEGNYLENIAIIREISQEIAAKETYWDLFDNSPDLIYVLDEEARFITVNQSVVEKYGYPKEFSIGKTPEIFGVPGRNDMQKVVEHIQKAWEGEAQYFNWWSITATGHIFPKELVIKKGKYFGKEVLIATGRDISQRHEMEQKLQESYDKLKKANEEITNFIFRASHDLRAPVASLQGLLQIMRYAQNPQELEKYMNLMEKQLHKMDNSIGEIIDYRKIATAEVEKTEVDIQQMVDTILESLSFSEGYENIHKNIQLNLASPIVSDKQRLMVILDNLISNSLKYYDKNKTKSYLHIYAEEVNNIITLTIEDNGIGIDAQHHQHIFDMYYRATNQVKGTGLGLSIVKEALNKIGGSISLASEVGKGCKFTIKFLNLHRI